jgi:hypothetical protein
MPHRLSAHYGFSQTPAVDLGAFTKEILAVDIREGRNHLAMWLPFEFFVAATLNQGKATKAEAERGLDFLRPYLTLVVQSSIDQPDGRSTYASEKEVRARAVLKLSDGTEVYPLDSVPPLVSATMSAMKTLIAAEGDAGSANVHIIVFPALTKQAQKIVDTTRKDKLTLVLKADARFKETSFTWRTPFDAMASVPDCPRCKAGVSAKWTYCPYCGQKLP